MNHSIALGVGGACVMVWIFCTLRETNSVSQNPIPFDPIDSFREESGGNAHKVPPTF